MAQIRKRLSWLVAGWLAVQCLAPLSAHVAIASMAISTDEAACVCPPGTMAGAKCPMHQKHQTPDSSASRCAMRSPFGTTDAVFVSLLAPGVMPVTSAVVHVPAASGLLDLVDVTLVDRTDLPDSPPPRA